MDTLTDKLSLAEKLEADLRDQLKSGALKHGMKLLPERELCLKYQLGRGALRKVLLRLAEEGLLSRDGRRGTTVRRQEVRAKTICFSYGPSFAVEDLSTHHYIYDVYHGMEKEAAKQGWDVALQIGPAAGRAARWADHWADGFVVCDIGLPSLAAGLLKAGKPFVLVDYPSKIPGANSVFPDNINGGYMAAAHLRELGHERIGFVYPLFNGETTMQEGIKARSFGYQDALGGAGAPLDAKLMVGVKVGVGYKLLPEGEAALRAYLSAPDRPTAVFVPSDSVMPEFYRVAGDLKLRIPEDLSVVGFEGLALSETLSPPLTTIHVDRAMMGQIAIQRLKAMFEGETLPVSQVLPVQLIKRSSATKIGDMR